MKWNFGGTRRSDVGAVPRAMALPTTTITFLVLDALALTFTFALALQSPFATLSVVGD